MAQLKTVNKAIAKLGLELVKGEGYFYFDGEDDRLFALKTTSVYVPRVSDLTLAQWIEEAEDVARQIEAY